MTATQKIYAILKAAAGVTTLVGAAKIKPQGDWQNLAAPYIVHFPVPGLQPTMCEDGPKPFRIQRHQVSIFALDEGGAEAIAQAVVAALNGYYDSDVDRIALAEGYPLGFESDLKVAHYALEFTIAGALAC